MSKLCKTIIHFSLFYFYVIQIEAVLFSSCKQASSQKEKVVSVHIDAAVLLRVPTGPYYYKAPLSVRPSVRHRQPLESLSHFFWAFILKALALNFFTVCKINRGCLSFFLDLNNRSTEPFCASPTSDSHLAGFPSFKLNRIKRNVALIQTCIYLINKLSVLWHNFLIVRGLINSIKWRHSAVLILIANSKKINS